MGTLVNPVQRAVLREMSVKEWRHKLKAIEKMWAAIDQAIERLSLSFDRVRLYQDGLPLCGRGLEIVTELAGKGSRNHVLHKRLIEKSGCVMGTESP